MTTPAYRRVLLKLSGEALMGEQDFGIDPNVLARVANEIKTLHDTGVQAALVIGGGNIFRGVGLQASGMNKVAGDQIGMLATVMNALAMQDALIKLGLDCRVLSAMPIGTFCETYDSRAAIRHLNKGRVIICSAGTGSPFFTTDSAASLRAIEIEADCLIKATKVDGVYDADPMKEPNAKRFSTLSYDEIINCRLAVMDTTAVVLCRDNNMPLRVLNMGKTNALFNAVVDGLDEGTLITA